MGSHSTSANCSINCLLHTSESQPLCVSKAPRTCILPHLVYLLRLRRTRYAGDLFDAGVAVRKNSMQQTRNSSTSSSAGLMLAIITGRPPGCLTRMWIQADNISNQRQFLWAGNPVPKKQPCIDPIYATTFLCPHSPLFSLSVCPPMICALTCSNKP